VQEVINNSFKEVGDWSNKLGLHPINMPILTCEEIANINNKSLELMSFADFEDFLNRLASYNIYIKAQKGSIEAQIEIIQFELDKVLFLETNNLGNDYRYKSIDEKIAVVRTIKPDIDNQGRRLTILKAQLFKIKDMPFAIDKKIEMLRIKYTRRMASEKSRIH